MKHDTQINRKAGSPSRVRARRQGALDRLLASTAKLRARRAETMDRASKGSHPLDAYISRDEDQIATLRARIGGQAKRKRSKIEPLEAAA